MEGIILKTTPSYESDFFFMVNFKQHFKTNGWSFYAVVFDLLPDSLYGFRNLKMFYDI